MSSVPMVFDDGTSAMVPQEKLQAAMQDGGRVVQPMLFDDGSRAMVPLERVRAALQDGGQVMGQAPQRPFVNMQPDNTGAFTENRFTITPQDGENFSDTMQRAAQAGKTVTPAEIKSQSLKGLLEAPAVLASAPTMGAAGAAGLTALGGTPAVIRTAAAATPQAISAIKAMAEAHPYAAKLISKALEGAAATAGGLGTYRWIKGLLPSD